MENMGMIHSIREFYKGKKVLVTGHTGFKGAWLSLWLHEMGAVVTGYALEPITNPNLYQILGLENLMHSIIGDIRKLEDLEKVVQEHTPEIIFHLAAQSLVRRSYDLPRETYETNVLGTVNVFEIGRLNNSVKTIINVTSDKCYENKETQYPYKESDPMGGRDPYSSSKGCAELVTQAYIKSFFNPEKYNMHRKSVASARAGNVIGGGDWAEDRLIPDLMKAYSKQQGLILRNPDAVRPWQHVLECLWGYLVLAKKLYSDSKFSGPWNFSPDDKDVKSVKWVCEKSIDILGNGMVWEKEIKVNPHEAQLLKLDNTKAKKELDWEPAMDLEEALNKTIVWYKQYYSKKEDMVQLTKNQINDFEKSVGK